MSLFVGLGNPGNTYAANRHNVGFLSIDYILAKQSYSSILKSAFKGDLFKSEGHFYLKPTTFMNASGVSVSAVSSFYKIPSEDIFVLYDDLDLAFGCVRFRQGGGHGGHNGLRSINSLIANDYYKIKLGIGRPEHKSQVTSYVLGDFDTAQQKALDTKLFAHIYQAHKELLTKSFLDVASQYSLTQALV